LICEFIIFRFVLIASDIPRNDFINGVIRLKPNQEGIYRIRDEVQAHYKINSNGWNSKYNSYALKKFPDKPRIAIIGDSYVQAHQVDFDKSFAEKLEQKLGADDYEVYRFGISGAPLSQYLHILRKEVLNYAPDVVIVLLVHNDFEQSYNLRLGRYTRSFLRLKIISDHVEEILPQKYEEPWYTFFRGTATYRYLVDRQRVNIGAIKRLIFNIESQASYQANIDIISLQERLRYAEVVTNHVFKSFKNISENYGIKLLIIMDGDRGGIYQGTKMDKLYSSGVLRLNLMAREIAEKYILAFIDLHPIFEKDYRRNHKRFNYRNDGHWNEYGHEVVAEAIYQYLLKTSKAYFRK
jgi:lysophospholipase L1-like esterase